MYTFVLVGRPFLMAAKRAAKRPPRRAVAGRCPACDRRTLRGLDDEGDNVEVELPSLTAAEELRHWIAGRPTWAATWSGHIELDRRTAAQIRDGPAGYAPGNTYPAHRCTSQEIP